MGKRGDVRDVDSMSQRRKLSQNRLDGDWLTTAEKPKGKESTSRVASKATWILEMSQVAE